MIYECVIMIYECVITWLNLLDLTKIKIYSSQT